MKKVFSFEYGQKRFLAFAGITGITKMTKGNTNAVTLITALQLNDMTKSLLENAVEPSESLTDIPCIKDAVCSKTGELFNLTGTLKLSDGCTYTVKLTDNDIHYTKKDECPAPLITTFTPESLRLRLGSSNKSTGVHFHKPDGKKITISMILNSMDKSELLELFKELSRRFSQDTVPVQRPAQTYPQHHDNKQKKVRDNQYTRVQPVPQMKHDEALKKPIEEKTMKETFLETVRPDIAAALQMIPFTMIKECSISTSKEINLEELKLRGESYCISNNWQLSHDYYALDNVSTMERYFYNRVTGELTAIAISTLQKWKKVISE